MAQKPVTFRRKIIYWIIALLIVVIAGELFSRAYYYRRGATESLALFQLFRDTKKLVAPGLGGIQNAGDTLLRNDLSCCGQRIIDQRKQSS